MKLLKTKKSQAWSFDIVFAVIVFVGAFFVFYLLLKPQVDQPVENLREDAELVAKEILSESSPINIIEDGKIDEVKLEELLARDYSQLKKEIRVGGDFCIYLEDQDGNIIPIGQDADGNDITGIGSSKISISGTSCKDQIVIN